jgi:hypothetical protein
MEPPTPVKKSKKEGDSACQSDIKRGCNEGCDEGCDVIRQVLSRADPDLNLHHHSEAMGILITLLCLHIVTLACRVSFLFGFFDRGRGSHKFRSALISLQLLYTCVSTRWLRYSWSYPVAWRTSRDCAVHRYLQAMTDQTACIDPRIPFASFRGPRRRC